MSTANRIALVVVLLLGSAGRAWAQSPSQESRIAKEPAGSASGRVTLGGKPVSGITVALMTGGSAPPSTVAKSVTDPDGRFQITGIAGGQYRVVPFAPWLVVEGQDKPSQSGKKVTIGESETIEHLDFTLRRGGVITGRVTDADGNPLTGERIILIRLEEGGQKQVDWLANPLMHRIDDRGLYRAYGLAAGRYIVGVGDAPGGGLARINDAAGYYGRTFHPRTTDQSKATVVELGEGEEVTGVDVLVGGALPTFEASGRIVDLETGEPISNSLYGWAAVAADTKANQSWTAGYQANSRGEFHIGGLLPGHYAVFGSVDLGSDSYSDSAVFEIAGADVRGLEVKLRRGGEISGAVVIRNAADASVLQRLQSLDLTGRVAHSGFVVPRANMARVRPDGSFRFAGLPPGDIRISLTESASSAGFRLLQVQRNGIDQPNGVTIASSEQVSEVRVVMSYGTAAVRGQVRLVGGALPAGSRLRVSARLADDQLPAPLATVEVDARGRFAIESLPAGEYEITVAAVLPGGSSDRLPPPSARQRVGLVNDTATETTMVLDVARPAKEREP